MTKSYCWYCRQYVDCEERIIKLKGEKLNTTKGKFCKICGVMLG